MVFYYGFMEFIDLVSKILDKKSEKYLLYKIVNSIKLCMRTERINFELY